MPWLHPHRNSQTAMSFWAGTLRAVAMCVRIGSFDLTVAYFSASELAAKTGFLVLYVRYLQMATKFMWADISAGRVRLSRTTLLCLKMVNGEALARVQTMVSAALCVQFRLFVANSLYANTRE